LSFYQSERPKILEQYIMNERLIQQKDHIYKVSVEKDSDTKFSQMGKA